MVTEFFRPFLEAGETAHLVTAQGVIDVVCVAAGALPGYTKDFGALTAGVWSTDNEDGNLELDTSELGQYRMRILDDVQMRFNNLASTRQWRTSKINFTLGQFPMESGEDFLKEYMFAASEFFIYGNDTPRFDFYCERALATSRVKFSGWRFKVREIPVRGKKDLWISGWPSGAAR